MANKINKFEYGNTMFRWKFENDQLSIFYPALSSWVPIQENVKEENLTPEILKEFIDEYLWGK